jgi:S-adenosylmethionine synthetase
MFEKVNPCHPDKVADRIAGAIVDLAYAKSDNPKVAVEVLIGHGRATVMIESSEQFRATEIDAIVRRIAGPIELDLHTTQQDPHLADNQQGRVRCGDNGIFKGSAPTEEQRVLTSLAATIYANFPTDGKYISDISGRTLRSTICQSHATLQQLKDLYEEWAHQFLGRDTRELCFDAINHPIINPLGEWTGGPDVDCGATNRKLGSDMGDGVTGGGLHGKDLSKADVSVNIWCYLESIRTGHQVEACCSIGDETVNGIPYADIVEQARLYIHTLGGFEKFAEWGLIRPDRAE